jgi:ornithine cyclodeaminase
VLNAESVSNNLSMQECIDQIESLYVNESEYISLQPLRVLTRINEDSHILTMPGHSKNLERFAVKIVSEYKKNPELFDRKIQGGIALLFDSRNAELLATLDATSLTAIRTGALCGLATKLLSRQDSRKAVVIGSGTQARTQLEGVCAVRKIEEALVYSREFSHALNFAEEMSTKLKLEVEAVRDKDQLRNFREDILIIATNATNPVLSWQENVFSGMHINSIGVLPDRRELDVETLANSRVFVDLKQGVLQESGDVIFAIKTGAIKEDHIIGDLSDLLLKKKQGRLHTDDVTLFKSVGFALLDVYAASKAYDNAVKKHSNSRSTQPFRNLEQ